MQIAFDLIKFYFVCTIFICAITVLAYKVADLTED